MEAKEINEIACKLAKTCSYEGETILEVLHLALTDANFHKEAKLVEDILTKLSNEIDEEILSELGL